MKILLTADGSEYSEGAARFLTQFSFSTDDEITVLHVIKDIPFKDDRESYLASLKKIKEEIASKILDSVLDILKPVKAKISVAIKDGFPDKVIIDTAVESGMDLIVMGSRGLRGIKSLLIGSAAKAVAINSPKPLLVVKPAEIKREGALKVLYATDGSDYSIATGRLLTSIPLPEDTEVTILYAMGTAHMDIPERFHIEIDERIKEIVAKMRESEYARSEEVIKKAREVLGDRFSKIVEITKVGEPSEEILNAADFLGSDIIAIGSSGMRGLRGVMGSVSRGVLGHSRCTVLIGKLQ